MSILFVARSKVGAREYVAYFMDKFNLIEESLQQMFMVILTLALFTKKYGRNFVQMHMMMFYVL